MACRYLLKLFREGKMGRITLDDVVITTSTSSDSEPPIAVAQVP